MLLLRSQKSFWFLTPFTIWELWGASLCLQCVESLQWYAFCESFQSVNLHSSFVPHPYLFTPSKFSWIILLVISTFSFSVFSLSESSFIWFWTLWADPLVLSPPPSCFYLFIHFYLLYFLGETLSSSPSLHVFYHFWHHCFKVSKSPFSSLIMICIS